MTFLRKPATEGISLTFQFDAPSICVLANTRDYALVFSVLNLLKIVHAFLLNK